MQSFSFLLNPISSTSSEQDGNKPPGNLTEAIHTNFVVSAPCDITKRPILPGGSKTRAFLICEEFEFVQMTEFILFLLKSHLQFYIT